MEGAVIMAMSNTLYSEISFKEGRVVQSNYPTYPVTRMRAAPRVVDVHLVETEALPGGIGEPGVPPASAALCNAIYSATKVRIRQLPVGKQLAGAKAKATASGGATGT
jgi:isoquinoline 1-oxidoreductase subunit beta